MINVQRSREQWIEACYYLAGGVASSLRASMKPTPLYVRSAKGVKIIDLDGNEYIDYLLAYGPLILGHAHPVLTEKIHEAMTNGFTYGLQHDMEVQLAKRLTELLPCAELVAYSGSGTEAVMLALRLARAFTGKKKIVRFYGHYHGWSDTIFTSFPSADLKAQSFMNANAVEALPGTSGQSEACLEDIIVLPWNDESALEAALSRYSGQIAAVITEPVMCNSGCIAPKAGYLESMRKWTEEHEIVLIFDEVITGFRLGLGGAQGKLGIKPDLMTMGKAMAGGIPLSAVAGKREIMDLISNGVVNHLGTLNGNCIAMAAGLATLDELSKDQGAVYRSMESHTEILVNGIRKLLDRHQIPGLINQMGPVFHMMFTKDTLVQDFDSFQRRDANKYSRFAELLLNEGVLARPSGLWYLSTVHGEEEIELTLQAIDRALERL